MKKLLHQNEVAPFRRTKKIQIKEKKLVLVERADEYFFVILALQGYLISRVQVLVYNGINDLPQFLKNLPLFDEFSDVESLLIFRDAETNSNSAVQSINSARSKVGLSDKAKEMIYTSTKPRIGIFLFCDTFQTSVHGARSGSLEDFCSKNLIGSSKIPQVNSFIQSVEETHGKLTHKHKSMLHSLFSFVDKLVGAKIGEAAKYGAFNWNAPEFADLKKILQGF